MTFWPEIRLVKTIKALFLEDQRIGLHPYYHPLPLPLNIDEKLISASHYSHLARDSVYCPGSTLFRQKLNLHFIFIKSNELTNHPHFLLLFIYVKDFFISFADLLFLILNSELSRWTHFHYSFKPWTFTLFIKHHLYFSSKINSCYCYCFQSTIFVVLWFVYFLRLLLSQAIAVKWEEKARQQNSPLIPLTSLSLALTSQIPFWNNSTLLVSHVSLHRKQNTFGNTHIIGGITLIDKHYTLTHPNTRPTP